MAKRGDELIRDARAAAEFLREGAGDDPSNHDAFVAGLLGRLADQLGAARTYTMRGRLDDLDLIRQLEVASRECDSSLHEMAALRLRTALGRAAPWGWHPPGTSPEGPGWYRCLAADGRWKGGWQYRAWGNGHWWIPLADGWLSSRDDIYWWNGPVADVNGPAPDGTDPKPGPEAATIAGRAEAAG